MSQAETIANKFFDPTEFIGDQEKYTEVLAKKNELMKELLPYLEVMEMEKEVYNNYLGHQEFKERTIVSESTKKQWAAFEAAREKQAILQPNMKYEYSFRFKTFDDYLTTMSNGE